jgi:DNA-directed RNA polymerase beta' subunit
LSILKCICISCKKLLVTRQATETMGILEHKGMARLKHLSKYCESVEACHGCGKQRPIFTFKDNHFEVCYPAQGAKRAKADKSKTDKIPAESLISTLKEVSEEDCWLLGLNNFLLEGIAYKNPELYPTEMSHRHLTRPEWFFLTILPVLPPCARPPVYTDGKQREDDLTDGYVSVIKANIALTKHLNGTARKKGKENPRQKKGKPKKEPYDELCEKIRVLFDNKECKKTVNGQIPQGIRQLLCGKEGHIRLGVLGKRVNLLTHISVSIK